ncbi:MAG: type II secretion system F family protein, partial [Planctomycetota bacterium]
MPKYTYKGKSPAGRTEKGVLTARTEEEAIAEVKRRGVLNAKVKVQKGMGMKPGATAEDIVIFTRQLATMISAGIPLMEGLEILCAQTENPSFSIALDAIVEDIRSGSDLS